MPEKTLLVLANSVRSDPNRCVAARELVNDRPGRWVRPVSENSAGEVSLAERTLTNGREVAVLDVVRVPLGGRVSDALQPENWAIRGERTWEFVRRAKFRELEAFVETPAGIWNEPDANTNAVSEDYVRRHPVSQSLYLVKPNDLRVRFYTDRKRWRRALFEYGGDEYDLAITDPMAPVNYNARYPQWPDTREHTVNNKSYICVSLAHEPFRGRHFKLVATIIDPDHL